MVMIIDFHVHAFPDDLASKATAALARRAGIPLELDGTLAGVQASMKEAGIDCSVILNIATRPAQTPKITEWAAAVHNPAGGIVCFGSIHPDSPSWREELIQIKESGLRGIKLHPDYQEFFVDEPRMFPIYEKAIGLDLTVVFHSGVDIGLPDPVHCTPSRLLKVVKAFRGGRIVAAHMGGYLCWEEVERYLVGEDLYFDTSFSRQDMKPGQLLQMIRNHGAEKILFATDSPWAGQREELAALRSLGLTCGEEEAVLGLNAGKLLGLTCENN